MIALALAATVLWEAAPRVRDVRYPYLALQADVICVGTVASVTNVGVEPRETARDSGVRSSVQPFSAARLLVEEVWKGAPDTRELWFVGSSTWTCDITTAAVGEHLLLLLDRWADARLEKSPFRPELKALLHDQPFHSVAWAGRGRLPIELREDASGAREHGVDLEWLLPWSEHAQERSWRSLESVRELTRSVLAENELGSVLDPATGRPAWAAILRQEPAAGGTMRIGVGMALFEQPRQLEALWSVSESGRGAPWRRGPVKDGYALISDFERVEGARAWIESQGALPPCGAARELLVLRDPLLCCTRAEPAASADDAEARLWRELRRRIAELRPAQGELAPELPLAIGR